MGTSNVPTLLSCRARLVEGEAGYLNFENFYAEIAQLRTEMELDDNKKQILNEVEAFSRELESFIAQAAV